MAYSLSVFIHVSIIEGVVSCNLLAVHAQEYATITAIELFWNWPSFLESSWTGCIDFITCDILQNAP
ncbi:hypothetical protein ECANGB1_2631 [Enterospora canceri]|uniref:Uncharacterized protein n=1 Tax=Enterospora canceri TaxID=1081671 RepID=A0A1Y1S9C3_9MICR|nr:hypothetical protein ECANGB1_2631 [Enterospora canceri]